MKEKRPDYKIVFGKDEKESEGDSYNNMTVSLNLNVSEDGAHAAISFRLDEGYPEGQFDFNRKTVSKGISIEEAEQLVIKLNCFIARGSRFLEEYKEQ